MNTCWHRDDCNTIAIKKITLDTMNISNLWKENNGQVGVRTTDPLVDNPSCHLIYSCTAAQLGHHWTSYDNIQQIIMISLTFLSLAGHNSAVFFIGEISAVVDTVTLPFLVHANMIVTLLAGGAL